MLHAALIPDDIKCGFSRGRANPPDVLDMRVICPDAGIKDPNFHLGTIVALVP